MKLPVYPLILIAVLVIVGGVALMRTLPAASPSEQAFEQVSELDGDGDHDGDPLPDLDAEAPDDEAVVTPAPTPSPTPAPTPTPPAPSPKPSGYTMAEVRTHASATSCWTAIAGNVYDLTSWIAQHPGGKNAILRLCGTDGTAAFNKEHGGQSRPERELAAFKVGALI